MSDRESIAEPHKRYSHQRKKIPLEPHILPFLRGNSTPLQFYGTTIVYIVCPLLEYYYVAHDRITMERVRFVLVHWIKVYHSVKFVSDLFLIYLNGCSN